MGADTAPDHIRAYSRFYSHHHNQGHHPEIDPDLVLHDALRIADYGNAPYNADETMASIAGCIARVGDIVRAGALLPTETNFCSSRTRRCQARNVKAQWVRLPPAWSQYR